MSDHAQAGAEEAQTRRIVTWHANGHDALDRHGIPRFADGLAYTLAERIDMLADGVGSPDLIAAATRLITNALDRQGVSRTELAARLGKSNGFVSQVLAGDRNMTLRTLADFADALGLRVELVAAPNRPSVLAASIPKES